MRNASGYQRKVKMSGSDKKITRTYDISSIKRLTKKVLEVSRCGCAKQRQRNIQKKSVLHMQSCFFANYTYCCFSPFSGVAFAA